VRHPWLEPATGAVWRCGAILSQTRKDPLYPDCRSLNPVDEKSHPKYRKKIFRWCWICFFACLFWIHRMRCFCAPNQKSRIRASFSVSFKICELTQLTYKNLILVCIMRFYLLCDNSGNAHKIKRGVIGSGAYMRSFNNIAFTTTNRPTGARDGNHVARGATNTFEKYNGASYCPSTEFPDGDVVKIRERRRSFGDSPAGETPAPFVSAALAERFILLSFLDLRTGVIDSSSPVRDAECDLFSDP
jgi:hypothetical protein